MPRTRTTPKQKDRVAEEAEVAIAATSAALDLKDPETSVDDTVEELTPEQNDEKVKKATGKSTTTTTKKDEPKEKIPTTVEVAGQWIRVQLEGSPKTKEELIKLAAESNPAKFENPKGKDR